MKQKYKAFCVHLLMNIYTYLFTSYFKYLEGKWHYKIILQKKRLGGEGKEGGGGGEENTYQENLLQYFLSTNIAFEENIRRKINKIES